MGGMPVLTASLRRSQSGKVSSGHCEKSSERAWLVAYQKRFAFRGKPVFALSIFL
jgi:hypothetical protein